MAKKDEAVVDTAVPEPVEPPPSSTEESTGGDSTGGTSVVQAVEAMATPGDTGDVPAPVEGPPAETPGQGPGPAARGPDTATGLPTFAMPGTMAGAKFHTANVGLNRGLPAGTEGLANPTGGGAPQSPGDSDELRRALAQFAAKRM